MPSNQFRSESIDPSAQAGGKNSGYNVDPGPYEAIVMGHVEGSRSGQLRVYIPDWGGEQKNPDSQITVSYASPFFGTTYGTGSQLAPPGGFTSGMSYGMWCVPPDVGNKVLVVFASGDRQRGYWFACIYDTPSHHMVPAMARNIGGKEKTLIDEKDSGFLIGKATRDSHLPVSEYSTGLKTAFTKDGITNTPRYAHPLQSARMVIQGVDRDPVRGAISSSSMREAPSNVYGISTPGRPLGDNIKQAFNVDPKSAYIARDGGHSFVMDDGDKDGNDRLIRLRTAGGHQILMNDVADGPGGILYISSATGNQWMEFSADGSINVFGAAGINMRSMGPMNFHSDSAVNINSRGSVAINADTGFNVTSLTSASINATVSASIKTNGMLSLSGGASASLKATGALSLAAAGITSVNGSVILLNSPALTSKGGALLAASNLALPTLGKQLADVKYSGNYWQWAPGAIRTICSTVPAHEPWLDPDSKKRPEPSSGGSLLGGLAMSAGMSLAGRAASSFF